MGKSKRPANDDPNMSDRTLLVSVEDLINMAMGPLNKNIVNFKLIQTILHIIARQMRLLEQRVEIRLADAGMKPSTAGEEHDGREQKKRRSSSKDKEKTARKGRAMSKERTKAEKDSEELENTTDEDERKLDVKSKAILKSEKGVKSKETGKIEKVIEEKDEDKREKHKPEEGTANDRDDKKSAKEKKKSKSKERKRTVVSDTSVVAAGRRESIEVVTRSQFAPVEAAVRQLQAHAAPPLAALPDNDELRADLARGSATLAQAMKAMQVQARVNAAEQAIARLGGLLAELAASGALPSDLEARARGLLSDFPEDAGAEAAGAQGIPELKIEDDSKKTWGISAAASQASILSSTTGMAPVTHPEMEDALRSLRNDLMNNIQNMTTRAATVADHAKLTVTDLADKLNIAIQLDLRITTLNNLVADYADQLHGFDSGIGTQLQSFNDQILQMRLDLKAAMDQMEQAKTNAETTAVLELRERFEGLTSELDVILHTHTELTVHHHHLAEELRDLIECVEMLREQKADRDEVVDGLRDKADIDRLAGLLPAAEFAAARALLERRLDACSDKFRRQDGVWMNALKELSDLLETKAATLQLGDAQGQLLRELRCMQLALRELVLALGEPKAALVSRALSTDAWCGACGAPAAPAPATAVAPPPAPAATPAPPCLAPPSAPTPDTDRRHACHRWCGGSHTLLAGVERGRARVRTDLELVPTRHYTDYGTDGRLYMLEEELQPCLECNQYPEKDSKKAVEESTPECGAGDQGNEKKRDQ